MTKAEFEALYKSTKRIANEYTLRILRELKRVYEEGAAQAAQALMMASSKGLSSLTEDAWRQIKTVLEHSSAKIRTMIEEGLKSSVLQSSGDVLKIAENYILNFIDETDGKLTRFGIQNMIVGVDQTFVTSMVSRVSESGYTFSERVWRVGDNYIQRVKDVIEVGFSTGRDVIDIADDIKTYVKEGRRGLAKRYGNLTRGSQAWARRIRKNIDYNALRLVRSEMYKSLQEASIHSGLMNPGCTDMFDWIRNTSEDWGCECPEIAANSPYAADEIPDYPHPNCLCTIRPHLRDRKEFLNDLKSWSQGEKVDYLDEWYEDYYKAA